MSFCEINNNLKIDYNTKNYSNTSDPSVWGPAFWFSLHNGASRYPENPNPLAQERMKGFILGIPFILPCPECAKDAFSFIEKNKPYFNQICKNKKNLFEFFCNFHNHVNKKTNKKLLYSQEAFELYTGKASVKCLQKYN
jgi:hypothetical protein